MKKTTIVLLFLILWLNLLGTAWAGRHSGSGLFLNISITITVLYMVLIIVSSGYLIIRKTIQEKKQTSEVRSRWKQSADHHSE